MNRRTSLRLVAASVTFGLAGCVETLQELQLRTPVTIDVENEADESQELLLTAHDLENGHQTFEQAVSVAPGEQPTLERLSNTDQQVRIERPADGTVETTFVDERTKNVLITVREDDIEIAVSKRGGGSNGTPNATAESLER